MTSVDQGQAAGALGRLTRVGRGLGRIPVTLITLSLLLIAGIATGTLFAPANRDNPLISTNSPVSRRPHPSPQTASRAPYFPAPRRREARLKN